MDDEYATLRSRARSDAASALVRGISKDVEEWERRTGKRTYRRGPDAADELSVAIERFVGDLLAVMSNAAGTGKIFRPLGARWFTGEVVSHRDFRALREALEGLGLIEVAPPARRYSEHFGVKRYLPGKVTRFAASQKLVHAAGLAGIALDGIQEHFREELPRHPLVLKSEGVRKGHEKSPGRRISIKPTAHTGRLETTVRGLNDFLSHCRIEGGIFQGFERMFNECADQSTYQWNKGGRLYSVWPINGRPPYQYLADTERAKITIDGEPTCEIDIRACNMTIYHARLGVPFDVKNDPYERAGLPRDVAKAWIVASIGANKPIEKWSAETTHDYQSKTGRSLSKQFTARAAGRKVLAAYPALASLGKSGPTWADMMYAESEAIIGAMVALMHMHNVPSFPVHDSLIVTRSNVGLACDRLQESFRRHVGIWPWLSAKTGDDNVKAMVKESLERYNRHRLP